VVGQCIDVLDSVDLIVTIQFQLDLNNQVQLPLTDLFPSLFLYISCLSGLPELSSRPDYFTLRLGPKTHVLGQSPGVLPEALCGPPCPELRGAILCPPQCNPCKQSQLLARSAAAEHRQRLEVGQRGRAEL